MKKKFTLLFIMMLAALLSSSSAWAQTFIQGDMKYTVLDADAKTVSVAKANNDISGTLVLPSRVTNEGVTYTVTSVPQSGFDAVRITSLTIPASVTRLDTWAFSNCGNLATITIQEADEPLSIQCGYYAAFTGSNADKAIMINRNLTLTDGYSPFPNATSVVFSGKVTTINDNLFYDANKLASVTIGKSVKAIGDKAFIGCGDDTNSVSEMIVTIGENVKTIGNNAFEGCISLKSITLPEKLDTIFGYAFQSTGLTSIAIPASVDSIGDRAFGSCSSLANVRIEDSDKELIMRTGYYGTFAYSDTGKAIYVGRNLRYNTTDVPFANPTSVEIGDHVTHINTNMFYDANNLQSVTIGKGVKTIGENAFISCGDNTETVEEMLVTLGENVETIGKNAFNGCISLKSITLPEKLDTIFGYAFQSSGLTSITIPASVDSIAERAFGSCASLAKVRIEDSEQPLKLWNGYYGTFAYSDHEMTGYIGRDLLFNGFDPVFSNPTSVEIGDKVTFINKNLFYDRNNLQSVTIGKGVKAIGENAFIGCGDNTETVEEMIITLGENIETIGRCAFDGCISLKSITLPEKLDTIFGYAFQGTGLTSITIPASVDSIAERAFGSCASLAKVRIEDSEQPLKLWNGYYGTFAYSDADKSTYIGRDMQFNGNDPIFSNPTSVEFGDQVTTINPYLFRDATKLSSVTISNGVKTIGEYAFQNAGDNDEVVSELTVTMGEKVETIGNYAFNSCAQLKSITLSPTLKTIGQSAFSEGSLTAISIPGSVESIDYNAFGWLPLTNITLKDGDGTLTMVNGYYGTFRDPRADYTLYLGRNVETEDKGNSPFPNVTAVTIGPKVTNLQQRLFYDRDKLITVTGGENVETMGIGVYYGSNNIESISPLGKNLKVLPESTFEGCEKIDGIVLPDGLEEIQQWAFHTCKSLTELTIPASVKVIGKRPDGENGYRPFRWNYAMKKLVFEDSDEPLLFIDTYGDYLNDMEELEYVYMGRDINFVGSTRIPFDAANSIEFGPAVTEIGNYFKDTKPTSVKAPWTTPIAITDEAFNSDTYKNATLWLPGGTKQAYAEADGWKNFVNVDFASFLVTGTATKGGTLAFADLTVTNGTESVLVDRETDVTFTVTPEANYDFTSLIVDGTAVNVTNNTYTYANLLKDIEVKAAFTEKPKFDIKATATGGTVSLNGANFSASQNIKVYRDTDVTLAIAANEGYEQPKVAVNGTDVTAQLQNNTLKLENIQEAKTIVVTFTKMKFQIAKQTTQNGTITLSKTVVEWGDSFTATFTPATGYELATATLNNQDVTTQVANNVLTVTNVKENKTVGATFKRIVFNVTISGGGITVSNTNPQYGENVTVTIDDDPDLTLVTLLVNGVDVTAQVVGGQYIIKNVTGNVTVEATFRSTKEFITLTGEYATFSCPQDLDFTGSDLRAYIASGFNKATNQVLLTRVKDVPAGTGVFLVGQPGETYKIPYSTTSSIYMNFFVANLQKSTVSATTGNFSNYTFGEQAGDPGFYPVSGSTTLLAQTAYLQLPTNFVAAGVKVSVVFEDDIIDGTSPLLTSPEEEEQIYDLAGRRLGKTQRGINIVNGKKILVK